MAWFTTTPVLAATRGHWGTALGLAVIPISLIALFVYAALFGRHAEEALVANERRVEEPPPKPRAAW